MVKMLVVPAAIAVAFGLVSGCVASDSSTEAAVASEVSTAPSGGEAAIGPATTNGCVQITQPRTEFWSESGPAPGDPTPLDWYKMCVTQSDCSRVCEGIDVVPSVYSWHLTIKCTKCN
jgi:hypothetical protein